MYHDHKDLLSVFHSHNVKYLIVGGYAVIFHSQPRFTKDIDLWVRPDRENARAVYAALAEFGAPLEDIQPDDFANRGVFFRFGYSPSGIDILPDVTGKGYFISRDDLIASKLATGRPRDLLDVEDIRAAIKSLEKTAEPDAG